MNSESSLDFKQISVLENCTCMIAKQWMFFYCKEPLMKLLKKNGLFNKLPLSFNISATKMNDMNLSFIRYGSKLVILFQCFLHFICFSDCKPDSYHLYLWLSGLVFPDADDPCDRIGKGWVSSHQIRLDWIEQVVHKDLRIQAGSVQPCSHGKLCPA